MTDRKVTEDTDSETQRKTSWTVRSIRQLELKKAPSVSETIDWARTLMLLNIDSIDAQTAKEILHILLKYQSDIAKAAKEIPAFRAGDTVRVGVRGEQPVDQRGEAGAADGGGGERHRGQRHSAAVRGPCRRPRARACRRFCEARPVSG